MDDPTFSSPARSFEAAATAPPRPGAWMERVSSALLFALAPRLTQTAQQDPPDGLIPWESVPVPRGGGLDPLPGIWFPSVAKEGARGAVLLLHPWLEWGKAYFYRRGRVQALRKAGYHSFAPDLGGFGGCRRRPGFADRDVEAGLATLSRLAPGLPLHVWGVSAGGYWAHLVLSRTDGVSGAVFEDVSPNLLDWSWRMTPRGRPAYFFFRNALPVSYRFLDVRRHAPALRVRAVTYIGGGKDRGVRPEDTQGLASAAGGLSLIVPGADHLAAIKVANAKVIELALDTFRRAEAIAEGA